MKTNHTLNFLQNTIASKDEFKEYWLQVKLLILSYLMGLGGGLYLRVECLPSMPKVLDSFLSRKKRKRNSCNSVTK